MKDDLARAMCRQGWESGRDPDREVRPGQPIAPEILADAFWNGITTLVKDHWRNMARTAREFFHVTEEQLERGVHVGRAVEALEGAECSRDCEPGVAPCWRCLALVHLGVEVETPA